MLLLDDFEGWLHNCMLCNMCKNVEDEDIQEFINGSFTLFGRMDFLKEIKKNESNYL